MRGKGNNRGICPRVLGITPAHAGKSDKDTKKDTESQDHPRTCGEKLILYTDRC